MGAKATAKIAVLVVLTVSRIARFDPKTTKIYGMFSHEYTSQNLVSYLNLVGYYSLGERLRKDPIFLSRSLT